MPKYQGFTLIELLITVAVLAIITAVAYPSYSAYMQKTRRIEAIQTLYKMQLAQEDWRISHPSYTSTAVNLISTPSTDYYTFGATVSGSDYTLSATAKGDQQNDKQGSATCTSLTLTRDGSKAPASCWQ
ncbi:prepilin-type N-terminal cleavage/methylation domain-containing protein [Oceanimonas sp. NS1]|uniref:Type IV pilin n=2 Tax=Aeromonadaceae TaxID=84642 RepID=A0A233RCF8_9GAMM|nr:prepilin-type N-terminal cleavage/methylation domain-containing protein [Oceanimonas sp. NS1]OXY81076.1 type IV pilin [Oceanimonas doudoroffii]